MTVPLLSLVGGVILWCIWLTIKLFQSEKDIAINTAHDNNVGKQIEEIKADLHKRLDRFENHVNAKFDQVFSKIENKKL